MNNKLRSQPEVNPLPQDSSGPAVKTDVSAKADDLIDFLKGDSDRALLLVLAAQMLETRTEMHILQATVNTLLIELCHRQPDKLSQSLARMSAQRRGELLTQYRTQSEAFARRACGETGADGAVGSSGS